MRKELRSIKKITEAFLKYDEKSEVFKKKLKELGIEKKVVPINQFKFTDEFFYTSKKECYLYTDEYIYNELSKFLKKNGIQKSLNDIAYILKKNLYRKLLIEVNNENQPELIQFNEEYYSFYKLLQKDINSIRFQTNKKGEACLIQSKQLIELILSSYKRIVLQNGYSYDLITMIEQYTDHASLKENIVDNCVFELMAYIQTMTNFSGNSKEKDVVRNLKFSNKQCELVHELLLISKIIEEPISSPKDNIRNKIIRFLKKKKPKYIHYFKKSKQKSNSATSTPDNKYLAELFKNKALINSL